jgi:hypothetical protein
MFGTEDEETVSFGGVIVDGTVSFGGEIVDGIVSFGGVIVDRTVVVDTRSSTQGEFASVLRIIEVVIDVEEVASEV